MSPINRWRFGGFLAMTSLEWRQSVNHDIFLLVMGNSRLAATYKPINGGTEKADRLLWIHIFCHALLALSIRLANIQIRLATLRHSILLACFALSLSRFQLEMRRAKQHPS
jgi:hypothetical protein